MAMTRRNETRRDTTRPDKTRHDPTTQDKPFQGDTMNTDHEPHDADIVDAAEPFRRSIYSQRLAEFLDKLCEDPDNRDFDTIYTYPQLSAVAGCDVQRNRHVIDTARRIVSRERLCEFGTIRGEGIKLLRAGEIVDAGVHATGQIRRHSIRTIRKLANAPPGDLTDTDRTRMLVTTSYLGAIELMTRKSSQRRIQAACAQTDTPIDTADLARLFAPTEEPTE